MNSIRRRLLLATVLGTSGGCSVLDSRPVYPKRCDQSTGAKLNGVNLISLFEQIAKEICVAGIVGCDAPRIQKPEDCASDRSGCDSSSNESPSGPPPLLVADFVRVDNLTSDTEGLLMGELLRASLSKNCCRRVVQIEIGRDIRMSERGIVTLTRSPSKVKALSFDITEVIVGTYHNFGNKLIITVKMIDTTTQTIINSATREIVHSC